MKRAGIILELKEKHAVVMTSDAEFITIKREPEMYTGAPVEFNTSVHPWFGFGRFGNFGKGLLTAGLAGFAAILVLTFAFFYRANNLPSSLNQYAFVTIDINPSVELILNLKLTVIDSRSINEDGRALLQGKSLLNMPLTQALLTLVRRAEQENYLSSETERAILVSTVTNHSSREKPELLETAISQCNSELTERKIQMQYIQATLTQRKIALENQLSTGRYALMTYTQSTGQGIDLETAKTETIGRLLNASGLQTNFVNSQNNQHSSNTQMPLTGVLSISSPGSPGVPPTNSPNRVNTPNSFTASSGLVPSLTPLARLTVSPIAGSKSPEDRLAAAISNAYSINVSGRDIADLRVNQKLGYGEIGFLYGLTASSMKTTTEILAMRQSGMGWGEIAKSFGLKVSDLSSRNSSILKAAQLSNEDQKMKEQLNQEEKNHKNPPKPTHAAQGNPDSHSNSSPKNPPGKGK